MIELNHKDLWGGALIALTGGYVAYSAAGFGIGNAARMGPGYVLVIAGVAMVVLGLAMAVASLRYADPLPGIAWRPLVAVTAGMIGFALSLRVLGLVPAVCLLVGLSAIGDPESRPLPTTALAVGVALGMWVVFVLGLRIPLPAFALDF
ncbi:tripartite tricarboxylate transporter TctB family protein [Pelagibacterium sediminicola]|uniref:tripartite tricarboxylate transporter TctB family protein n=1 Tax=Pelagibacterium sediminicola TaxID=2248761 RepID=UPI000E320CAF|nr:tripartite tricarboxylate transporter TctB family protein [Pelagibacterium sediminicola]